MLEKVKQVEGDMRKDLDIMDDSRLIAERVRSDCDDPSLLQGEIDALRLEVESLHRVAAKLCDYVNEREGSGAYDSLRL